MHVHPQGVLAGGLRLRGRAKGGFSKAMDRGMMRVCISVSPLKLETRVSIFNL